MIFNSFNIKNHLYPSYSGLQQFIAKKLIRWVYTDSNLSLRSIIIIILIFFILGEAVLLLSARRVRLAEQVLARCAASAFKPACYDEEIPKLMDRPFRLTMEEAFELTRKIQKIDPKYLYCHVLAHKISFKETGKDVSKWKDVVARCPATMCNNGCQHGALMRRFNSETLTDTQIDEIKPDLADVCEPRGNWKPVEVERSMCYHAIGHLAMYVTRAKVDKSVEVCRSVTHKSDGRNYEQTCTEGVLMSVFQPLEPEEEALVKDLTPKKETVGAFCRRLAAGGRDACFRESWPLFLQEIQTPAGLMAFCSYTTNEAARWRCFGTAMNILTVYLVIGNDRRLDPLIAFCAGLGNTEEGWCLADAASRLIQIDPAYMSVAQTICQHAQVKALGETCFSQMAQMIQTSFQPGTTQLEAACRLVSGSYRSICLGSEKN